MNRFKKIKKRKNIFYDKVNNVYYIAKDKYTFAKIDDEGMIRRLDNLQNKMRISKKRKALLGSLGLAALLGYGLNGYLNHRDVDAEIYQKIIADNMDEDFEVQATRDYLSIALNNNQTISMENREKLHSYIELISQSYQVDTAIDYTLEVAKRIKNYDFSNMEENSYPQILGYLLCGNDELGSYIGYQLYDEINDKRSDESEVFGLLSMPKRKSFFNEYILNDNHIIDIIAQEYQLDANTKKELLHTLKNFLNHTLTKEQIMPSLQKVIITHYQDAEIDFFDDYILGSQAFYGDFKIYNNDFNRLVAITVKDRDYGDYDTYYDRYEIDNEQFIDYTEMYYIKQIKLLIDKFQGNLNYDDQDCRFLMYIYGLTRMNDYQDLDYAKMDNYTMAAHIYNTLKEIDIDKRFVAAYFTNGTINYEELFNKLSVDPNLFDIALFQEMNCIFRLGLSDHTIDPVMYANFINKFIDQYADTSDESRSKWLSFWLLFQEYNESMIEDFDIKDTEIKYSEDTKEAILKYSASIDN